MPIHLDQVVPWGRSLDEYVRMFALDDTSLSQKILGVGDGPASFNAELHARGGATPRAVSVDPIYLFPAAQIRQRVHATYGPMLDQVRRHPDEFVWGFIRDPDDLGRRRLAAMETFLADFEPGQRAGRYLPASLPDLPFADRSFDLALCSHLLFLYSDHLSLDFHVRSILEMCRVATEARVFPLLMLGSKPSPHVAPVTAQLQALGHTVDVRRVPYEFQRGGNQMMVARRPAIAPEEVPQPI